MTTDPEVRPPARWARLPWAAIPAALIVAWGSLEVLQEHPVLVDPPRLTEFPATSQPDKITLSISEDPSTSISIQWRTSVDQNSGQVRFRPQGGEEWTVVPARTTAITDPLLLNDPTVHRHTARLEALEPGARYDYQVGHEATRSVVNSFSTAPTRNSAFQFIYMGDPQNGLKSWGELLRTSSYRHPDAAFYAIAGDLVDGGDFRDEWDLFFAQSSGVFDHKPIAPAIGNHENSAMTGPWMYLQLFDLPTNGPEALSPERAYFFDIGAARFLVLDSEAPMNAQKEWLEETLADNDRPWTIAMYHRPAYSSRPDRDNPKIRRHWTPLFDEFGVDLVLQGHDHAYMRTWPMREDAPIGDDSEGGTIYVVAVSGTKYYEQEESPLAAQAFTNVSTYQVIDVTPSELAFKAYTLDGSTVDEFRIRREIRSDDEDSMRAISRVSTSSAPEDTVGGATAGLGH